MPFDTVAEAIEITGSDRVTSFPFTILLEALPRLVGITLYLWAFNIRF